jgi:microcystin degradation protein MlrC
LIDIELVRAAAAMKMAIHDRRWPSSAKLKTDAWQKYGAVIAPELSYSDWLTVVKAAMSIDIVEWSDLPHKDISDELANAVVPLFDELAAGIDALAALCDRNIPAMPREKKSGEANPPLAQI